MQNAGSTPTAIWVLDVARSGTLVHLTVPVPIQLVTGSVVLAWLSGGFLLVSLFVYLFDFCL